MKQRERERESKIKDCTKCLSHIKQQIAKCEDWEKQRKSWFENLTKGNGDCFCQQLVNIPGQNENGEVIMYQSSGVVSDGNSGFCPKCKSARKGRQLEQIEGGLAEIKPDPSELGCPLFDEKEPCVRCNSSNNKSTCEKCKQPSSEPLASLGNARTRKSWEVCPQCLQFCQLCKKNHHEFITNEDNEKWEADMFLCRECSDKLPGNKKNKPTDKGKKPPTSNETCERCGASCIVSQTKTSYTWKKIRITMYYTDFRKEVHFFGTKCPCAEEFKKEHQQTCSQCQKHEFPEMKKGWMLDYEIKKAFCSPDCHVAYRKLSWDQAEQLTQIEMFPPELDVEVNPRQNTDWEQEGLRREVLYWRESVQELQRQLEESKKKPKNQQHPNEVPHQERQISYLLNLHKNTQQKAENAYKNKYGELKEGGSNNESNKSKGMSGGMIALIVVGVVALVGGIIFLLTRNKKKIK